MINNDFSKVDFGWNKLYLSVLERLEGFRVAVFGGVLRDIYIGDTPRDVDIVVDCEFNDLIGCFEGLNLKLNRFGGLKVLGDVCVDVWPLNRTWAIERDEYGFKAEFNNLPYTTFLNVDAIAALVQPEFKLYLGDGSFDKCFQSRILDINFEPNPSIILCVVRAAVFVDRYRFKISDRLRRFLSDNVVLFTDDEFISLQRKHYGSVMVQPSFIRSLVDSI